jgi:hypothetical protein
VPALILRSKYAVFREHEQRVRMRPQPEAARQNFEAQARRAERVMGVRMGLYVLLYFGLVAAVLSFLLKELDALAALGRLLQTLAGLTSSLAFVAAAGILACNRYLALADVQLHFWAAEARLPVPRSDQGETS